MNPTLEKAIQRTLSEAYEEAVERFGPTQSILLSRGGKGRLKVLDYRGYDTKPSVKSSESTFREMAGCLRRDERVNFAGGDKSALCAAIRRPPKGQTVGALYLHHGDPERRFHDDDLFAVEALASKTGAAVAMLHDRLLCKRERVLPTSDEVEAWQGIRQAGLGAFREGVTDMALVFLERAVQTAEQWGPCREFGTSLNDYGQVLRACNRLEEAANEFERGLAVLDQAGLERHPQRIPLLNNLAGVYHARGNLVEAESLYRTCLDILTQQEKDSPIVVAVLANLGVVSKERKRLSDARVWLQQALAASIRLHGEDHASTARCRAKVEELEG